MLCCSMEHSLKKIRAPSRHFYPASCLNLKNTGTESYAFLKSKQVYQVLFETK